ncbi:MAG: hypothetical protein INF41_03565 [Rhodospirillaceae bacterium]|jgi:hypothetical protein|nr:hypothetical protein [Rhodospirillaceae bacterium]
MILLVMQFCNDPIVEERPDSYAVLWVHLPTLLNDLAKNPFFTEVQDRINPEKYSAKTSFYQRKIEAGQDIPMPVICWNDTRNYPDVEQGRHRLGLFRDMLEKGEFLEFIPISANTYMIEELFLRYNQPYMTAILNSVVMR